MSHTNSTTHYSLPQFLGTDTPGWMTDVNSAMSTIDSAIYQRQTDIASNAAAITENSSAISQNTANIGTLTSRVTTVENSVSTQAASISALNQQSATNTQDIAALATRVTNLDAADIGYENTTSGLAATDTQGAIDELAAAMSSGSVEVIAVGEHHALFKIGPLMLLNCAGAQPSEITMSADYAPSRRFVGAMNVLTANNNRYVGYMNVYDTIQQVTGTYFTSAYNNSYGGTGLTNNTGTFWGQMFWIIEP